MTNSTPSGPALEALRHELDDIDDQMLVLLGKRFTVTEQVKSFKQVTAKSVASPLRPAREAQILRRLLGKADSLGLSHQLVLQLWRSILTQSSASQASITIHFSRKLSSAVGHRLRLRDHFGAMAVEQWRDEAQAMMQINATPGDLCVVEMESAWVVPFLAGQAGTAQVIGTLPVLKDGDVPQLLILGNAPAEPTGNDETLLITQGKLPRDFSLQPLWQIKSGGYWLSALAGFFSEHESPLVGLTRSNASLGLKLAGRYPSAFEV